MYVIRFPIATILSFTVAAAAKLLEKVPDNCDARQVDDLTTVLAATLSGCDSGTGIRVESSPAVQGTTSVTVRNSTIHDYEKNGITALGDGSSVSLVSNSIRKVRDLRLVDLTMASK